MAYVHVQILYENELFQVDKILRMRMLDITHVMKRCDRKHCSLEHDACMTDYLSHVVQEDELSFRHADILLVERQPVAGFTVIQEFFLHEFRKKCLLIHPRSLHCFYSMNEFKGNAEERREQRKEFSVIRASRFLMKFKLQLPTEFERQHDISDALLMIFYFIILQNKRVHPTRSKYFLY